jgi:hypothetical protein
MITIVEMKYIFFRGIGERKSHLGEHRSPSPDQGPFNMPKSEPERLK